MTVRKRSTIQQSDEPRRVESRMAPPKRAERQHARPGAGISAHEPPCRRSHDRAVSRYLERAACVLSESELPSRPPRR